MREFLTAHLRGYKGLEIHLGCHNSRDPNIIAALFSNAFLHFVFALSFLLYWSYDLFHTFYDYSIWSL